LLPDILQPEISSYKKMRPVHTARIVRDTLKKMVVKIIDGWNIRLVIDHDNNHFGRNSRQSEEFQQLPSLILIIPIFNQTVHVLQYLGIQTFLYQIFCISYKPGFTLRN